MAGEYMKVLNKRVEANDDIAIYSLGCEYYNGRRGLRQNHGKAMKLWLQAGELGNAEAYNQIAHAYYYGIGVERGMKKAIYYWELGAMGGDITARYNLGLVEAKERGNMRRAMKHLMISAGASHDKSLEAIRKCFMAGYATKDDFEMALRAHREAKDALTGVISGMHLLKSTL